MFMMNFLFDFTNDDATFGGDVASLGFLGRSKNWLKLDPTRNLPGLPPVPEPAPDFPNPPGF